MNYYFLVPQSELKQGMIGRSVSKDISQLATRTINNVPYYILEISAKDYQATALFDSYVRYTQEEIRDPNLVPPTIQARKILIWGALSASATKGGSKTVSYTMTQDIELEEIEFKAHDSKFGDHISVSVYQPGSPDILLDQFVSGKYICDDTLFKKIPKTIVVSGLRIDLTYVSVGGALDPVPDFYLNLYGYRMSNG